MKNTYLEVWADSFHEGVWCCDNICRIAESKGYSVSHRYVKGFQPEYIIKGVGYELVMRVYGSYKMWYRVPKVVEELLEWGKPDFVIYDPSSEKILLAVEETAAIVTGNQATQRCERQFGSASKGIPYWYLVSEYGMHIDGGIRRDNIWPVIAAIKLSILFSTPCIVTHYSDKDNVEDYNSGVGLSSLFFCIHGMLENYSCGLALFKDLNAILTDQYKDMIRFLLSQWSNVVDFLPSVSLLSADNTASLITMQVLENRGKNQTNILQELLVWPLFSELPQNIQLKQVKTQLLKFDSLCEKMESDVGLHKAYVLSSNAGSGKPQSTDRIRDYISAQKKTFDSKHLNPTINFCMDVSDFPLTHTADNRHITTSKNIVYLYDCWRDFALSYSAVYPRFSYIQSMFSPDKPVFVYLSNSIALGRIFGDPFTGQLTAYSVAFGKYDVPGRIVIAYYPHQVHSQVLNRRDKKSNKGMTLMNEIVDLAIFYGGVPVSMKSKEIVYDRV